MLSRVLIISSLLTITACSSTGGIKIETKEVLVPVSVPCQVETPVKPKYNFDSLSVDADIFSKVKAILADRLLQKSYESELEMALKSCQE